METPVAVAERGQARPGDRPALAFGRGAPPVQREEERERSGEKPVTVAELVEELERNASVLYVDQTLRGCAPDEVLEAIAVRGKGNQKLGQLLRYRKDTRYPSGFMLTSAGTSHRAVQWSVLRVVPAGRMGQATVEQFAGGREDESG